MTDPISNLHHSDESPEQHAERLLAEGEAKQEIENDDKAVRCEECDRLGWPTKQPLYGVEGKSLCWTHAQLANIPKP